MAEQGFPQKVEKIEKLDTVGASTPDVTDVAKNEGVSASTKVKFEEAVAKAETKWDQAAQQRTLLVATEESVIRRSPIEEVSLVERKIERLKPITIEQIIQQAGDTQAAARDSIAKIEDAQNKYPDFKISPAHEAILTDKLIHIDSNLNTALSKVGVEVKAQDIPSGQKPLVKFLNYLTNSDRQLSTLIGEVNGLEVTKAGLRPDQLLALQIKLGFVQTEIEFFTNVLNKTVEGTKTIMNVQV